MPLNEPNADVLVNARRGKWTEFFATLEPFDLSEVLKDVRSNDAHRPVDMTWLLDLQRFTNDSAAVAPKPRDCPGD